LNAGKSFKIFENSPPGRGLQAPSGRFTVGNFLGLGVSAMYSGLSHAEAA